MTGNPQNIFIVTLAYDDIGRIGFTSNMVLSVIAATTINTTMILTYYASELFPGSSGYGENMGFMFSGKRTPEMLTQEHAYYARQAANKGVALDIACLLAFVQDPSVCRGLFLDLLCHRC